MKRRRKLLLMTTVATFVGVGLYIYSLRQQTISQETVTGLPQVKPEGKLNQKAVKKTKKKITSGKIIKKKKVIETKYVIKKKKVVLPGKIKRKKKSIVSRQIGNIDKEELQAFSRRINKPEFTSFYIENRSRTNEAISEYRKLESDTDPFTHALQLKEFEKRFSSAVEDYLGPKDYQRFLELQGELSFRAGADSKSHQRQ